MKQTKIIPKKNLGQNFLINRGVQERIIRACALDKKDFVLEIGPGKGALTKDLVSAVRSVWAVERDKRCVAFLKEILPAENLTIYQEDILKFAWDQLPRHTKIIGNLPYNISTPVLQKIIEHRARIDSFWIMTQLEFAQRLLAAPGSKAYGSLSCFIQLFAEGKLLFKIKNTSFYPPPKVTSAFLHFKMLPKPRFPVKEDAFLFRVIRRAFAQRRKTLLNNLKDFQKKEEMLRIFEEVRLPANVRAEDCSLEQFVRLAQRLG